MSIVKAYKGDKYDDYSFVVVKDTAMSKAIAGAFRNEYNNRHFKSKNKKSFKAISVLLHTDDKKNIRLNASVNISKSKYEVQRKGNETKINLEPLHTRTFEVKGNTVFINQGKLKTTLELKRTLKSGFYKGYLTTHKDSLILVFLPSSLQKKTLTKKRKKTAVYNRLIPILKKTNAESLAEAFGVTLRPQHLKRNYERRINDVFKMMIKLSKEYSLDFSSVEQWYKKNNIPHENQVWFGLPYPVDAEIKELIYQDLIDIDVHYDYLVMVEKLFAGIDYINQNIGFSIKQDNLVKTFAKK